MKAILLGFTIALAFVTACNSNKKDTNVTTTRGDESGPVSTNTSDSLPGQPGATEDLVKNYLDLKNALTSDNGQQAAAAAKQMIAALENTGAVAFNADQKKVYDGVRDEIKEHAEHIGSNSGKIEHQREHFDMLSTDMYDLLKVSKPSRILYYTHCPMYNDNKGANWLSEVKEINNPYYGKKMRDCGVVKEEITP